jgi:hypothetical protein
MTNQEMRALALFQQLVALSPDDGELDLRVTIRLADGRFIGDVKLPRRDMEALTDALAAVNDYARVERDEMADLGAAMLAPVPELNPVALAQLQELDADFGDTDGEAA